MRSRSTAAAALDPLLKEHRFARTKLTWRRSLGDVIHVIELQPDARTMTDDVDAGVFAPGVYRLRRNAEPPAAISVSQCQARTGLARLITAAKGLASLPAVARRMSSPLELADLVGAYVIPALDRIQTLSSLRSALQSTDSIWLDSGSNLAYLHVVLGDREAARHYLTDGIARLESEVTDPRMREPALRGLREHWSRLGLGSPTG